MSSSSITHRLVADVGGTNTRVALFDEQSLTLQAVATYSNEDYDSFESVITHWLSQLESSPPARACIAVAAPPSGDRVSMINQDWSFSVTDVARTFGFEQLRWINDFEANAYALPHLGDDDLVSISHRGTTGERLATVGPGTGLGGATIARLNGIDHVQSGEPGFMSLAPRSDYELTLFNLIREKHPDIYAELLISGPGLMRLYRYVCQLENADSIVDTPGEVSAHAIADDNAQCRAALDIFCALLGEVCGNFVLANGAYGGLFLAGGILPRMIPFLKQSTFYQRFTGRKAMQEHLQAVPVHVITCPYPGLIGATHARL
ncbi:MAG: glucokinase [Halioglobus sp.]